MLAPIEAEDSLGLESHAQASRPTDALDHVGDVGATSPRGGTNVLHFYILSLPFSICDL